MHKSRNWICIGIQSSDSKTSHKNRMKIWEKWEHYTLQYVYLSWVLTTIHGWFCDVLFTFPITEIVDYIYGVQYATKLDSTSITFVKNWTLKIGFGCEGDNRSMKWYYTSPSTFSISHSLAMFNEMNTIDDRCIVA